jgi:hypothetical protein
MAYALKWEQQERGEMERERERERTARNYLNIINKLIFVMQM